MKINDNVIKLECTKGSYAYAVIGDEGVTLIDTSLPGRGNEILSELKTYGINLLDIKKYCSLIMILTTLVMQLTFKRIVTVRFL